MRLLATLPLSPSHIQTLLLKGYKTTDDLINVSPNELSKGIGIPIDEAREILKAIHDVPSITFKSALQILEEEENQMGIVTFCAALDDMLDGGIQPCKLTEICGPPGIGKTQLGMQLAVDVQIPVAFGGLGGNAVYIDCEGSFLPERVSGIAAAALSHLKQVASAEDDQELILASTKLSVDDFMKNINVFRCEDYIQLVALSHIMEEVFQDITNVKLVVIDSIAFPFRHATDDYALRNRLLLGIAQSYLGIARRHKAAVVIINQMTTKPIKDSNEFASVPALGESWGHACTSRVILSWNNNQRYASLCKSPCQKNTSVPFAITIDGVRDVEGVKSIHQSDQEESQNNISEEEHEPAKKRLCIEP